MYQPKLGRFMSRDPLPANGVVPLSPVPEMRRYVGQYSNGNTYAYALNDPINGAKTPSRVKVRRSEPAAKENEYYVCGRLAQDCIPRACGWLHVDIWTTNEGMIRIGVGGEVIEGTPREVPLDREGWWCTKLTRANYCVDYHESLIALCIFAIFTDLGHDDRIVASGSGKGKKCEDATDAEIVDCLRKFPTPTQPGTVLQNCQTDVEAAARGCCLMGYKGKSAAGHPPGKVPVTY
ncbi:MAG: hypothetical protein H8E66_09680 [Planctomycetes bacterium]|nr:hypothetical protein [Planctomycetota bacterium]